LNVDGEDAIIANRPGQLGLLYLLRRSVVVDVLECFDVTVFFVGQEALLVMAVSEIGNFATQNCHEYQPGQMLEVAVEKEIDLQVGLGCLMRLTLDVMLAKKLFAAEKS
jgi:hypothetical protein